MPSSLGRVDDLEQGTKAFRETAPSIIAPSTPASQHDQSFGHMGKVMKRSKDVSKLVGS